MEEIKITILQWLPHGKPLPDGWRVCDQRLDTHHNAHAVLIEEILETCLHQIRRRQAPEKIP